MADLPALRPIACVAALNATVQGAVGVVLSILALCACFCAIGSQPPLTGNSFSQYLTYYLQGEECRGNDYKLYTDVTSPTAMRVWVALSLFFSVFMCASSVVLVVAVAKRWSDEKLQITLVSWLFINTFTAVDDVILGYVFGHDYLSVLNAKQQDNLGSLTLGVVTFLAVRGVYVWLLNLALILYLFTGARALHKYLNEQMPTMQDQEPIESWPTLDDFGKSKVPDIERTPTAVNPRVADRENGQAGVYPEYTAMARWPTLNGEAQTVREIRPQRPREESRERRSKTVREYSFRNKEGFDNPAYEEDNKKYYLRLQSDTGSTRDYEEFSPDPTVPANVNRQRSQDRDTDRDQEKDRNRERQREQDLKKNRGRERSRERELERELPSNRERENYRERERNREREKDLPKNQRREIYMNSPQGEYRQKTPDPWNEKTPPPPPSTEYLEETEVPIPPVDYLDPQPQDSSSSKDRPMSLQEAILDRTLRLKKVPEALKKGF